MATKKKSTTKKVAPKKATTSKKSTSSRNKGLRSQIGLRPETTDFMSFRVTTQTLYWLVLGVVVILFTLWLMHLQASIQALYDEIDANTLSSLDMSTKAK